MPIEAPLNTAPMNEASNRNGERSYVEHTIGTDLQLQAKMELHWFDHFSVEGSATWDWSEMLQYESIVRTNALGNFQTLLNSGCGIDG